MAPSFRSMLCSLFLDGGSPFGSWKTSENGWSICLHFSGILVQLLHFMDELGGCCNPFKVTLYLLWVKDIIRVLKFQSIVPNLLSHSTPSTISHPPNMMHVHLLVY